MKNKAIVEIRPAEGGADSKLLIKEMFSIYEKTCKIHNFKYDIINQDDNIITFCL